MIAQESIVERNLSNSVGDVLASTLHVVSHPKPEHHLNLLKQLSSHLDALHYVSDEHIMDGIYTISDLIRKEGEEDMPGPITAFCPNELNTSSYLDYGPEDIPHLENDIERYDYVVVKSHNFVSAESFAANAMKWKLPISGILENENGIINVVIKISAIAKEEWHEFVDEYELFFLNQGADKSFLNPCNLMDVAYFECKTPSMGMGINHLLYFDPNPNGESIISKLKANTSIEN